MIPAGTIIQGPPDQAYEVMVDIHYGMVMSLPDHFRAIGNAPSPMTGARMPVWLFEYLRKHFIAEAHDRG